MTTNPKPRSRGGGKQKSSGPNTHSQGQVDIPSLTDIRLDLYQPDPDQEPDADPHHVEITLRCTDWTQHAIGVPINQIQAASRHVAGILARIAVQAWPWVDREGQRHRCDRGWLVGFEDTEEADRATPPRRWTRRGCCGIEISEGLLEPATYIEDGSPTIYIHVPNEKRVVAEWIKRISGWLETISSDESTRADPGEVMERPLWLQLQSNPES